MKERLEVFLNYRNLLKELVIRDIRVRYRRSVLGILWSVLNPLMMMMILTWVFSNIFKTDIKNFAVYVLIGNIVFSFHSEATSAALTSILSNSELIKKVYIPKYLFVFARVLSSLVNLLFSFVALFLILILTKTPISLNIFALFIPLTFLLIFVIGLSLILATYNVFFRDLGHLYGVLLTAWMYFSAIFYPVEMLDGLISQVIWVNPIYQIISYMRSIIIDGKMLGLSENLYCLTFSMVTLFIGLYVFYKKQDKFILYM